MKIQLFFNALQLLQDKSIDDMIFETILIIYSLNIKINSLKKYLNYRSICKEIYKFSVSEHK